MRSASARTAYAFSTFMRFSRRVCAHVSPVLYATNAVILPSSTLFTTPISHLNTLPSSFIGAYTTRSPFLKNPLTYLFSGMSVSFLDYLIQASRRILPVSRKICHELTGTFAPHPPHTRTWSNSKRSSPSQRRSCSTVHSVGFSQRGQ